MIRVVVAEDSLTARALLVELFASDPDFVVVGEARDGVEAVELTRRLCPDIVTMDIHMPRMDGLAATRLIMAQSPTRIVVVSGSLASSEVAASMQAIRAGALMALAKPPGLGAPDFEQARARLLSTVKALASVKVVRHRVRAHSLRRPARSEAPVRARVSLVAVAASTGGPGVLRAIFDALPYDFPVPVLVVQHLAAGFLPGFVEWLGSSCRLRVTIAQDGERVAPGTVYIAAEDRHLEVTSASILRQGGGPPVSGFRPSASVLFESAANAYGASCVGVILTGMGNDGVLGLHRLRALGGRIIAQDEQSSAVFGMPAAAIEEGLANYVLPATAIAAKLVELVGEESGR